MDFTSKDPESNTTFWRSLIESCNKYCSCCFSSKLEDGAPSILKAWATYEHTKLPRRKLDTPGGMDRVYDATEPGPTDLYEIYNTPEKDLSQWGIGVSLYFYALRFVGICLFFIGLLNLSDMDYFYNVYTSDHQAGIENESTYFFFLYGSAVCTDRQWAPCSDCTTEQWDLDHLKYGTAEVDGSTLVFVKRNVCDMDDILMVGLVDFVSVACIILIYFKFLHSLEEQIELIDESIQTTADYSVVVTNPPEDAYDPEIWKNYFDQFSKKNKPITLCTVVLDNHELLSELISRRRLCDQLRLLVPGIEVYDEEGRARSVESAHTPKSSLVSCLLCPFKLMCSLDDEVDILRKIERSEENIRTLQKKEYKVKRVFITFESEEGQRNALSALDRGKLMNCTGNVDPSLLFCDSLPRIKQTMEPLSVRYLDLTKSKSSKFIRLFISWSIFLSFLTFNFLVIEEAFDKVGPTTASVLISIVGMVMAQLCYILNAIEIHTNAGRVESSLTSKITLAYVVNTVFLCALVTPFTRTLSFTDTDLLPRVAAIFVSNMIVAPITSYLNIGPNFKRLILAPCAKTQEEMDSYFDGATYTLAERYSSFMATLFLCFSYSAMYPISYLFAALTCFINYYVDKFCLLRIWKQGPRIGAQATIVTMKYFFAFAMVLSFVRSAFTWSAFPFDNTCVEEGREPFGKTYGGGGSYDITLLTNETETVFIRYNTPWVQYCNQDYHSKLDVEFKLPPALPEYQNLTIGNTWMTPGQEKLTEIYGWGALVVVIIFVIFIFGHDILVAVMSNFKGMYEPIGKDMGIDFSFVQTILAYVPQVQDPSYAYPLLACDIDDIEERFIGWKDPDNNFDFHNLIYDVPYEGMKRSPQPTNKELSYALEQNVTTEELPSESKHIFDYMKYWKVEHKDGDGDKF